VMSRGFTDCGWATLKGQGSFFCRKKKLTMNAATLELGFCPCLHWVHRLRIDRLRGKNGPKRPINH
jgi:hypothetical protein